MKNAQGGEAISKNLENVLQKEQPNKLYNPIISNLQYSPYKSRENQQTPDALIDFTTSIFYFNEGHHSFQLGNSLDWGRRSWLHIALPSCCPGDSRDDE